MTKYFRPLFLFFSLQLVLLIVFLFFPALGSAETQLVEHTTAWANIGWGWTWIVGSLRLIVVVLFEFVILFITARAFLAVRD